MEFATCSVTHWEVVYISTVDEENQIRTTGFLLMFGEEFTKGGVALTILSFGYLVNAAMGSVGTLLVMTGRERDAATSVGATAVMNVILNVSLIAGWGLEGAATATAISMIVGTCCSRCECTESSEFMPLLWGGSAEEVPLKSPTSS